jgi:hypothetical protein
MEKRQKDSINKTINPELRFLITCLSESDKDASSLSMTKALLENKG